MLNGVTKPCKEELKLQFFFRRPKFRKKNQLKVTIEGRPWTSIFYLNRPQIVIFTLPFLDQVLDSSKLIRGVFCFIFRSLNSLFNLLKPDILIFVTFK